MRHLPLATRRAITARVILQHRKWVKKTCHCERCLAEPGDLRLQAMALDAERMAGEFHHAVKVAGVMTVREVVVL